MKLLLVAFVALLPVACSIYPTPLPNKDGGAANFLQFAGKAQVTYNADGSASFIVDNEISWQHTMQTAAALGIPYIEYLQNGLTEVTARLANKNLTSLERARLDFQFRSLQEQLAFAKFVEGRKPIPGL